MKFLTFAAAASLLLGSVDAYWKPSQRNSYNIMLYEQHPNFSSEKAEIVEVDFMNEAHVREFKNLGKKVICYFSGGTIEKFRSDYNEYFKYDGLVRDAYPGWPDERFVDYRKSSLKPLLEARMRKAISIGCDALDVDNIDLYQVRAVKNWSNPITRQDAINFATWVGSTAHSLGIAVGLKNCFDIADVVGKYFDFGISEGCARKNECQYYKNFLSTGKPVFAINYHSSDVTNVCKYQKEMPFTNVFKDEMLKQYSTPFNVNSCGSIASPIGAVESPVKEEVKKPASTVDTSSAKSPVASNTSNAANAANAAKSANTANAANNANAANTANAANANTADAAETLGAVDAANPADAAKGLNPSIVNGNNTLPESNSPNNSDVPNNRELKDQYNNDNEGSKTGTIVTGVAITGSVIGAAAFFVFLKKNPKHYESIKRSLSRSATTVKRGASQLKRKLTTRRDEMI